MQLELPPQYSFVLLDDGIEDLPPHIVGICPRCNVKMIYIHDLRCDKCDNQYVQYCIQCEGHFRMVKVKQY